jgi:hypothetical protein
MDGRHLKAEHDVECAAIGERFTAAIVRRMAEAAHIEHGEILLSLTPEMTLAALREAGAKDPDKPMPAPWGATSS